MPEVLSFNAYASYFQHASSKGSFTTGAVLFGIATWSHRIIKNNGVQIGLQYITDIISQACLEIGFPSKLFEAALAMTCRMMLPAGFHFGLTCWSCSHLHRDLGHIMDLSRRAGAWAAPFECRDLSSCVCETWQTCWLKMMEHDMYLPNVSVMLQ